MLTPQNYGEGEDNANPTPQKDNAASKTPPTPYDWQSELLLDVALNREDTYSLFSIIDLLERQFDHWNPIPGLTDLLDYYLTHKPTGAEYIVKNDLIAVIRLIRFLTEIGEHYKCFEMGTDYHNVSAINEHRINKLRREEGQRDVR